MLSLHERAARSCAGLLECMTNEHNAFAIRLLQEAQFHVVRK